MFQLNLEGVFALIFEQSVLLQYSFDVSLFTAIMQITSFLHILGKNAVTKLDNCVMTVKCNSLCVRFYILILVFSGFVCWNGYS